MDDKTSLSASDLNKSMLRVKPFVHRCPVLKSRLLNEYSGAELYFKCENFQRTGSYKIRGATNAIIQLPDESRARGVLTHSSGNFAQALALAAANLGVKAYIVMPQTAAETKKQAVRQYGGILTECGATLEDREEAAQKIARETGASFIHPSNDITVICGQATAAMELLEDIPGIQALFAPVGGGGLISGTALAAHYFGQDCRVIGGEPMEADDAYRSFHSGYLQGNESTNTIADGLRTVLGDITFPIIQKYVDTIIRVSEAEIVASMRLLWERMKIVAEPSSAVALAALLSEKEKYRGASVGILISGGNTDLGQLPF